MPVITISRESGSEGSYIAERVAEELGYHFADKATIGSVLAHYGLLEFEQEYDSAPGFWARFTARGQQRSVMVDMLTRVTLALAYHGNVVIVGRGSFAALAGLADVINVRIQAPFPVRLRRVMEEQGITDADEAEAFVRGQDGVRAAFVESTYGVRIDAAGLFDLVIDTGKVPPEIAVRWLVELAGLLAQQERWRLGRTTEAVQVDPSVASAVASELGCEAVHR